VLDQVARARYLTPFYSYNYNISRGLKKDTVDVEILEIGGGILTS